MVFAMTIRPTVRRAMTSGKPTGGVLREYGAELHSWADQQDGERGKFQFGGGGRIK